MRLITRKLWRAFPELDRFEDGQCQRFVVAAVRDTWPRVIRWVVVVLAGFLGVVLGIMLSVIAEDVLRTTMSYGLARAQWGVVFSATFTVGGGSIAAMIARDMLVRWHLRRVLAGTGCPVCRYSLLGIPVPASGRIQCPECGEAIEANRALVQFLDGKT